MAVSVRADVVVIGAGIVGTFIAKLLTRKGRTVALIDRGEAAPFEQQPANPPIECSAERHGGVYEARNHVLGGNGHYWGGVLLRPQSTGLGDVIGVDDAQVDRLAEDLEPHFRAAELDAGAPSPLLWRGYPARSREAGPCSLVDYFLLTGKARNLSARSLQELRKSALCKIFTRARVLSFTRNSHNHISAIRLAQGDGLTDIQCSHVVVSAGTVDTLLMLQEHAESLGLPDTHCVGENLHDHIATPIAMIANAANNRFMQDMMPLFGANGFSGRQFGLNNEDVNQPRALLRFIPMLDEASPYKEIKEIYALRQKGASPFAIAKAAASTALQLPLLTCIGFERYVRKRLYVSDELPVQALLIFESSENRLNRIRALSEARADMHWRMNSRDEDAFIQLTERAYHLLDELAATHGVQVHRPALMETNEQKRAYLHAKAMDAYHLGGGLPYGRVIDHRLRLIATPNMRIVATAVLQRPGLPNPTLTLLALAHRCAQDITGAKTRDAREAMVQRRMSEASSPRCAPRTSQTVR